jgi:hypothetical protein
MPATPAEEGELLGGSWLTQPRVCVCAALVQAVLEQPQQQPCQVRDTH